MADEPSGSPYRPAGPSRLSTSKMYRWGNKLLASHLSYLLDNAIESNPNVELAVLHLIRHYQFNLKDLTNKLVGTAIAPSSHFCMH